MFRIVYSTRFKRDMKRVRRRNLPSEELFELVELLSSGAPLPPQYHDHPLQGEWVGCRECHIRPDWLLIYRIEHHVLTLILMATGTHTDLFK